MKHSGLYRTGFALALSAMSLNANAIPAKAGLDACAQAIVNDLASNQGAPVAYKLDSKIISTNTQLGKHETFHLDALNRNGGEVVARVTCIVNQKAEVTRLIKLPLDAKDARLRATSVN